MKSSLRNLLSAFLFMPLLSFVFNGCTVKTNDVAKMSWQGKTYQGQTLHGKPDGLGTLTDGDSIIYSGIWKNGLRQGRGWTLDSLGNRIDGVWNHDTLTSGVRRDSTGVYSGDFNRQLQANGYGTLIDHQGTLYEGFWQREVAEVLAFPVSIVSSE